MSLRRSELIALSITVLSFLFGFYFYPQLPEEVSGHWNIEGLVDGYLPKFWGAFLIPLVLTVLFLVFLIVPKIDPRRANIEKFRKYFDNFIIALFIFFFYLYLLTLAWNLGAEFSFLPALSVLFYFVGVVTEKSEPNWTIGIRTPWTLSNETVWRKTHNAAGRLFKTTAAISILGAFFQKIAFLFFIIPLLFTILYSVAFSCLTYRKEIKR